jgi:hypothetical protein
MATAKKAQGKSSSQAPSAARSSLSSAPGDVSLKKTNVALKADMKNVAQRAYEIYCERKAKGIPGTAETDWEQAEEELRP